MNQTERNQHENFDTARIHAIVSGIVQGVGFRYFVIRHADDLGLKGWVRNTMQGEVEVVVEGTRSALEQFLLHLKSGPQSAHVSNVDVNWQSATGEFSNFQVKPTA